MFIPLTIFLLALKVINDVASTGPTESSKKISQKQRPPNKQREKKQAATSQKQQSPKKIYPEGTVAAQDQYIPRQPTPPGTHYGIGYNPKKFTPVSEDKPQRARKQPRQLWWEEKFTLSSEDKLQQDSRKQSQQLWWKKKFTPIPEDESQQSC